MVRPGPRQLREARSSIKDSNGLPAPQTELLSCWADLPCGQAEAPPLCSDRPPLMLLFTPSEGWTSATCDLRPQPQGLLSEHPGPVTSCSSAEATEATESHGSGSSSSAS